VLERNRTRKFTALAAGLRIKSHYNLGLVFSSGDGWQNRREHSGERESRQNRERA